MGVPAGKLQCYSTARPGGFEPPTVGLEVRCSIQLSYGRLWGLRVLHVAIAAPKTSFFRDWDAYSHCFGAHLSFVARFARLYSIATLLGSELCAP